MSKVYLHDHPEFENLISILSEEKNINAVLIEKDYWIMHTLYALQAQGFTFYLKGGTSLSKGFNIIDRFSEDIDILIEPLDSQKVFCGKNQDKLNHIKSREQYFETLAKTIAIDGIVESFRDHVFDDEKLRSAGIRLIYPTSKKTSLDLKEGILLEIGFDQISPNLPITISSWAYERAKDTLAVKDNRAFDIPCYHPGYTFVEKLQAISTKYRKQQETGIFSENFMRHYYDVYCLLSNKTVLDFIDSNEYSAHKAKRFRQKDNQVISENEAFQMSNSLVFKSYENEYQKSISLYYKNKPTFENIMQSIRAKSAEL